MSAELSDLTLTTRVPDAVAAMLARRDIDTDPCPALHVIAGLTPWADHQPRHAPDKTGRCRFCHTTIPTIKGA